MWIELVKEGIEIIRGLINNKKENKEKCYKAIEAIHRAANRTNIYITKSIKGTYKSNQELSDIWMEAASFVRELDGDLYNRLLYKADYWSNPRSWSQERINEAKISLSEIKKDSSKILKIIK